MIPVLYEDTSLIVCLKPPGLLSQDGPGGSLPEELRQQCGGDIFPVHRLDREAGGVMAYARTGKAAAALSEAVRTGALKKQYLCLVRGKPEEDSGTYRDLLLHDKARNKSFVVDRMRGGVKEAVLDYRVLGTRDGISLVLIRLRTGRTHQIRVQFASRKTPLLGDGKYGGGSGQLALWSTALAFPHPLNRKTLSFHVIPEGDAWETFREELDTVDL